jgi:hypothetical protein
MLAGPRRTFCAPSAPFAGVLRQTLGEEAIVASGNRCNCRDLVWWGVVVPRCVGRALVRALELYRGDFLDGFFVRNAADFDQWAMAERSRLQRLATQAASALADVLQHAGRLPEAAAAAERALELSPCDETLFRNLIRLLIAADTRREPGSGIGFVERLAILALRRRDDAAHPRGWRRRVRSRSSSSLVARRRSGTANRDRLGDSEHRRARTSPLAPANADVHRTRAQYFTRALRRDPRSVTHCAGSRIRGLRWEAGATSR